MNVEAQVISIIRQAGKLDEKRVISAQEDLFIDLGIDSYHGLKILGEVEEKFGITIADDRLSEIHTVGKLVQAVKAQLPLETLT